MTAIRHDVACPLPEGARDGGGATVPSLGAWFMCGYGAILFVDETDAKGDDPSRFIFGRLVSSADHRQVMRLSRALAEASAETWHASDGASLFDGEAFDDVCSALEALDSWVLESRLRRTESNRLKPQYQKALDRARGAAARAHSDDAWRRGGASDQITLYDYLYWARIQIAEMQHAGEIPGRRALIVCDGQPWLAGTTSWLRPLHCHADLASDGFDIDVRVLCEPEHPDALELVRWLGLVDSELWALGRIARAAGADGRTIDDRMDAWVAEGRPDVPVITAEIVTAAFHSRPLASEYLERVLFSEEGRRRTILLNTKPPPNQTGS